jgi:transposase
MKNDQNIKSVGLDVHKDTISLAIAENGSIGEVRLYGTIKNTTEALDKVIRKLISSGSQLQFVYEAGPCGFGIFRHLTRNGLSCMVAAPSLIPQKSGLIKRLLLFDHVTLFYQTLFFILKC